MSADLHDLRAKITARSHCALEARSRATGKERSEIVREILDDWAADEVHAANVLHKAPLFKPAQHLTLPSKGALYLSPQGRACRFMRMVQANDGAAAEAEFMYESDAGRTGPREGFTLAARNFWLLKQVG